MKHQSQQGIALVITLILLSVITFMAVTFLVVSHREGEQVDTTTQQNVSKAAAVGMEQMAEAQLVAGMLGQRNGYNFGLAVSTNFYWTPGFDSSTANRSNLYNVNYNYPPPPTGTGLPLNQADQLQMLNNLLYLPRAPVFITTNKNQTAPEFRFYHDLNGNGVYDTNGPVAESDVNGNLVVPPNSYIGDPEWIGFLEHPEQRHSSSNFFLSRGAFIAVPIGNSLDINYIHNSAKFLNNSSMMTVNPYEGFFRNQGVGPWEINLAAFLQTLNTNIWGVQSASPYAYSMNSMLPSSGFAIADAANVLQYRYNLNFPGLNTFNNLYTANAFISYVNGGIDAYAAGPLMTGVNPPPGAMFTVYGTSPWSGADNPALLIRPRDLLTTIPALSSSQPQFSFTNHLYQAGVMFNTNPPLPLSFTNSYNRYTLYRLLAQMGFGSAPEPAPYPIGGGSQFTYSGLLSAIPSYVTNYGGRNQMSYGTIPEAFPYMHGRKMNLNYNNINFSATNFVPWTAAQFFTNAADRLLRLYFPTNIAVMVNGSLVVTNININFIPIYPINDYTPAVHRALQLAANMYDATMNKNTNAPPFNFDYPSVFRPIFNKVGSGANSFVSISGYYEVSNTPASYTNQPLDLRRVNSGVYEVDSLHNQDGKNNDFTDNVYGIPYVIGARTNLPNFNQFSMASVVQITRFLQLTYANGQTQTNVLYGIGISNVVGVQCWNSYTNYFYRPKGVRILAADDYSLLVSNTYGGTPSISNAIFGLQQAYTVPASTLINPWTNGAFAFPILTNAIAVAPGSYLQPNGSYTNAALFTPLKPNPLTGSYFPDWGINVTNRLRVIILDNATGRILDYVQLGGLGQLGGLDSQDSVLANLNGPGVSGPGSFNGVNYNFWSTNAVGTNNPLPQGINSQLAISVSSNLSSAFQSYWVPTPGGSPIDNVGQGVSAFNTWLINHGTPTIQVPFAMTVTYEKYYTWSANDPLVHYTVGDLTDLHKSGLNSVNNQAVPVKNTNTLTSVLTNLALVSPRYQPWNTSSGIPPLSNIQPGTALPGTQVAYKDPMIQRAQDWQFPTNKYPNIGWLGRVHRGTPWQTIYLKSPPVDFTTNFSIPYGTWQVWTGDSNLADAIITAPTNDWQMLDLFTTAPNDNAGRGQLSVNQTNTAAWAALLDGVITLSNIPNVGLVATNIDTTQPGFFGQRIITNIIAATTSFSGQSNVFTSIGQILAAPQLTVGSPYLNLINRPDYDTNLTDAVYERIPQQIMSLLRTGTPRYAIYAYGQALKPADKSIVQSGASIGMCTNYQITGEVLTRTIVRFDNMPVPGQPVPGTTNIYALPALGLSANNVIVTNGYVVVTNVVPPMRAVVESFTILGPDQ